MVARNGRNGYTATEQMIYASAFVAAIRGHKAPWRAVAYAEEMVDLHRQELAK